MIKNIDVPMERSRLWVDPNVVYAQVPGWCEHVTANLHMTVVYHDDGKFDKKYPLILFVCGGGWKWVNEEAYLANFMPLAERGYVLASAEYQCSNDAQWPAPLIQLKEAVRYLRANAGRYYIDPESIGIMGESSGGHLASLVGTTNGRSEFERGSNLSESSSVQAVCSWYTPVALDKLAASPDLGDLIIRFLNGDPSKNPELAAAADPRSYITNQCPPFLLLHGTKDTLVPIECSEMFYKALKEKDVDVTYYRINGSDHADYPFFQPTVLNLIGDFFDQKLNKGE